MFLDIDACFFAFFKLAFQCFVNIHVHHLFPVHEGINAFAGLTSSRD